jgi:tight adherence protein B
MKRVLTALVAVALSVAVAAGASAAEPDAGLRLSQAGNPDFPDRSYLLSLPSGTQARPDQISVREDGRPVSGLSIVPASSASSRGFGVVLAIDTSRSMKGRAIRDAMAAARAFARRRHPSQQIGVVTFSGRTTVALPLTADAHRIEASLSTPPALGRDTHVYDAVDVATRMLAEARVKPASVVVLSDGSDTGSAARPGAVAERARNAGVRVFSVGLRSGAFDPKALAALARGANGSYQEAGNGRDLNRIYDDLGARLANEHLIFYRSLAGPHDRVHVVVRVEGQPTAATAEYTTPALRMSIAPYVKNDFWGSPASFLIVSLVTAMLVVASVYFAFTRPGRRNVRRRVADFVSAAQSDEAQPDDDEAKLVAAGGVLARFGRRFEQMRWWPAFEEELDVAGIGTPATQFAGATFVGTLVLMLFLALLGGPLVAFLGLLAPVFARRFVKFKLGRQRKLFADQLADNLQVISSALRAGHSLVGAMSVSVQNAPEPTKREFGRVVADEKLGVPLEDGLSVVSRRMASRDLVQVMLVASLQRETGGNTAEVIDRVADTVRERADLRRLISTLTAQGRISRWIVTALPLVLLGAISALNPAYLAPLFSTSAGHVMLGLGVFLMIAGSLSIKKIVNIEV